MRKLKFQPACNVILQMNAFQEVEAIENEGKMYVLYPTPLINGSSKDDSDDMDKSLAKGGKKAEKEVAPKKRKTYTEDEMIGMDTKELVKIAREEFDIEPDDFEGKNSNKKVRLLILEAQDGGSKEADEDDEDEDEKPAKSKAKGGKKASDDDDEDEPKTKPKSKDSGANSAIVAILKKLDSNKIDEDEAAEQLTELGVKKASKLVDEFLDSADVSVEEFAAKIAGGGTSKSSAKEEPAPAKKGKSKTVDIEELEEGDEVEVYFDDEDSWEAGTVEQVKKGKVKISYDDDTEGWITSEDKVRRA